MKFYELRIVAVKDHFRRKYGRTTYRYREDSIDAISRKQFLNVWVTMPFSPKNWLNIFQSIVWTFEISLFKRKIKSWSKIGPMHDAEVGFDNLQNLLVVFTFKRKSRFPPFKKSGFNETNGL